MALGDIDGQFNTARIGLDAGTGSGLDRYPAVKACLQYSTTGTNAGEWYLPALGELVFIVADNAAINIILGSINGEYPNDSISSLQNNPYWSSTEYDANDVYYITLDSGGVFTTYKNAKDHIVIPWLAR